MALQEEFEQQGKFLFRYRGILPVGVLFLGLLAYIQHVTVLPEIGKNITDSPYNYFCLAITLIGLGIRIYTVGHTPANTSGRNTKEQVADELNTTGVYSLVRHPLYVGNFFMWSGLALLSQNAWLMLAFIFLYWVYYERIMFAEEQFLRKKFEVVYLDWAKKTPAFIPRFTNFKKNTTRFMIWKAVRQEKTGFTLVFLLYFFFYQAGSFVILKRISIQFNFWFYAMLVSVAAYLLIKIVEKRFKTPAEADKKEAKLFDINIASQNAES